MTKARSRPILDSRQGYDRGSLRLALSEHLRLGHLQVLQRVRQMQATRARQSLVHERAR